MKMMGIGELLMRLTVPDYYRFTQAESFKLDVGGSEANVAIGLSQLGWDTSLLSALPDNDLGKRLLIELEQTGLDTSHIYKRGERIGLYFLEEGSSARSSRIIFDRSDSSINYLKADHLDWDQMFKDIDHLHWSAITPALSENAADLCLRAVEKASELGLTISCDLHYRKNLWSYGKHPQDIIPALLEKSTIVLGDPTTINSLTGLPMDSITNDSIQSADELVHDYRLLMNAFPSVKYVSMLLRTVVNANHHKLKGALVSSDEVVNSKSLDLVNIVDRIGGGDAYMAGLLFGLNHFKDKEEALDFALTTSALKHTIKGDYFLGTYEEVIGVMKSKQPGKIIR